MKKIILFTLLTIVFSLRAQNYNPIINYTFNGTPKNGVKIKTNIPFADGYAMPTIMIEGYNYGQKSSINLTLNWYTYNRKFISTSVSSSGNYTPEIKLFNENSKVIIFINDKQYYNRFTVRGYAKGLRENDTHFKDWAVSDEIPVGTTETIMEYKNKFAGNITFPKGIWNKDGDVGIGTSDTKGYRLAIAGKAIAEEVTVKLKSNWPDYVFSKNYDLPSLEQVENHIKEKGHLENIPTAKEVKKNGVQLGEMNKKLLQKIEELTLYTIQQQKELDAEKERNNFLEKRLTKLEKISNQKLD